jgi:hypothetical protein
MRRSVPGRIPGRAATASASPGRPQGRATGDQWAAILLGSDASERLHGGVGRVEGGDVASRQQGGLLSAVSDHTNHPTFALGLIWVKGACIDLRMISAPAPIKRDQLQCASL